MLQLWHVKAKNIICEGLNTEDIFYIKYFPKIPFLNSLWTSVWWLDDFFEYLNFQWFWCRLNRQRWTLELQTISTNLISMINIIQTTSLDNNSTLSLYLYMKFNFNFSWWRAKAEASIVMCKICAKIHKDIGECK